MPVPLDEQERPAHVARFLFADSLSLYLDVESGEATAPSGSDLGSEVLQPGDVVIVQAWRRMSLLASAGANIVIVWYWQ